MNNTRTYDISYFCEFVDKELEREFLNYDMRRYSKVVGNISLIFGVIYLMFLIADYFVIKDPLLFTVISIIRVLVLIMSVIIYLAVKINYYNYNNLPYLISTYKLLAIIGFLIIIGHYESLTLLSFSSVMVIILAVYTIPNKLIYAQAISVILSLAFLIFNVKHIENMEPSIFLKIVAYNLIIIIFCNIGAYLNNFYKRKQFADNKELLRVSITDPLTGIYNRAKFIEELNQWVDYCNKYENAVSLVMFDIDDFKRINDCYGHFVGDSVLQDLASTIKGTIRNDDVFARWGGEEFVILLPNTDICQAMEIIKRVRSSIQNRKYNKIETVTCSFGLAELKRNETKELLLQRADKFLYEAKRCGKNAIICETGEK